MKQVARPNRYSSKGGEACVWDARKVALVLTDHERVRLDSLDHRSRTAPHLARRARIILACAEGHDNKVVAKRLRMSQRPCASGAHGLFASGWTGCMTSRVPARLVASPMTRSSTFVSTLEAMPRGATHWSVRSMAKASGLGRTTVQQIWRAFGLQPHRAETFKLSTDPLLIEKVRDIVGLYMHPPNTRGRVLCEPKSRKIRRWIAPNPCCRCDRAGRAAHA